MERLGMKLKITVLLLTSLASVVPAHAMWRPSTWFAKTQKAAQETTQKEVVKTVEKITPLQDYAIAGAKVVANAAGQAAVGTAKFAWNHPKTTLATAVVVAAVINKDKINKLYKKVAPYIPYVAGAAALGGAAVAARPYVQAANNMLGIARDALHARSSAKNESAVSPLEQASVPVKDVQEEYNKIWYGIEDEQEQVKAKEKSKIDQERNALEDIERERLARQETVWQAAQQEVAQKKLEETTRFESAWNEANPKEVPQEILAHNDILVEHIVRTMSQDEALRMSPQLNDLTYPQSSYYAFDSQKPRIHMLPEMNDAFTASLNQSHPWVQEYNNRNSQTGHKWVDQFINAEPAAGNGFGTGIKDSDDLRLEQQIIAQLTAPARVDDADTLIRDAHTVENALRRIIRLGGHITPKASPYCS